MSTPYGLQLVTFKTGATKAKLSDGKFAKVGDRVWSAERRSDGTYFSLPGKVMAISVSHAAGPRLVLTVRWTNGVQEQYFGRDLATKDGNR